jgi:hypothetical protein
VLNLERAGEKSVKRAINLPRALIFFEIVHIPRRRAAALSGVVILEITVKK